MKYVMLTKDMKKISHFRAVFLAFILGTCAFGAVLITVSMTDSKYKVEKSLKIIIPAAIIVGYWAEHTSPPSDDVENEER